MAPLTPSAESGGPLDSHGASDPKRGVGEGGGIPVALGSGARQWQSRARGSFAPTPPRSAGHQASPQGLKSQLGEMVAGDAPSMPATPAPISERHRSALPGRVERPRPRPVSQARLPHANLLCASVWYQ
eukprot:15116972-Alexandrium_andersonii.AAC.2